MRKFVGRDFLSLKKRPHLYSGRILLNENGIPSDRLFFPANSPTGCSRPGAVCILRPPTRFSNTCHRSPTRAAADNAPTKIRSPPHIGRFAGFRRPELFLLRFLFQSWISQSKWDLISMCSVHKLIKYEKNEYIWTYKLAEEPVQYLCNFPTNFYDCFDGNELFTGIRRH